MSRVSCNVGGADRAVRLGVGATLIGLGIGTHIPKAARIAMGAVGAVGLITGISKYCPVSQALHLNTCHGW